MSEPLVSEAFANNAAGILCFIGTLYFLAIIIEDAIFGGKE